MSSFAYIVEKRTLPGILILDRKMKLVNINMETRRILDAINGSESHTFRTRLCPRYRMKYKAYLKNRWKRSSGTIEIVRGEDHYMVRTAPLYQGV